MVGLKLHLQNKFKNKKMEKKVRIVNGFNNSNSLGGVILVCHVLMGDINIGDKIIFSRNEKLVISEIEKLSEENKIAVTIYKEALKNSKINFSDFYGTELSVG